jgi:5-methylcytosine-specific restriction protein A
MRIVTSYKQALKAAKCFQKVGAERDSDAYRSLNKYFHWYYFEELRGFAPSKFVGYEGTTLETYKSEGTGTETTRALGKFFVQVPRRSQQFEALEGQLAGWLNQQGASLSRKTYEGTGGIYVRSVDVVNTQNGSQENFYEGGAFEVLQTKYERNPKARQACLEYHGYVCKVCSMDFKTRYGEIGDNFIHVHHLTPLASLGSQCRINPQEDLVPLCPNCHAMIHRLKSGATVDCLKKLLRQN